MTRQRDLPDGRGRLALLQPQGARRVAEHGAAERDGARGDHEHVDAAGMKLGDVLGERREPGMAQPPARPVDEQGRADLDDDAAEILEGGVMVRSEAGRCRVHEVVALTGAECEPSTA